MTMHRRAVFAFAAALLLVAAVAGQDAPRKPKLAFVTNCVAEFWTVGSFGVEAAKAEFGVDAVVRMPANGTAEEQKRILEDLLAKGDPGIAARYAGLVEDRRCGRRIFMRPAGMVQTAASRSNSDHSAFRNSPGRTNVMASNCSAAITSGEPS